MSEIKDEKKAAAAKAAPSASADILSDDTKRALKTKAKEIAKQEAEDAAAEKYLKEETEKARSEESARRGTHDKLDYVMHRIDVGPSAKEIRINGMVYQHGQEYKLRRDVYDCIRDVEAKTWEHERVRKGDQDENAYRLSGRTKVGRSGAVRA